MGTPAETRPPARRRERTHRPPGPEALADVERRVWDMALNLLHPAAFYVLFQLLILDHLGRSPAVLGGHGPLEPLSLLVYGLQFLGAWTVFYTTLLRDMGYRSAWGTVLLLTGLAGALSQYAFFPDRSTASPVSAWIFLGVQMALAAAGWTVTFLRWRRLRTRWLHGATSGSDEASP